MDGFNFATCRWANKLSTFGVIQLIGGGGGRLKCVPVSGGDGSKTAPPGNIFDQPPGEMSSIRSKLIDHVVQSPERVVLVTSPGTESSNLPPPFVERLSGVL